MGSVRYQSTSLATQKVTMTEKKEETQNLADQGCVLASRLFHNKQVLRPCSPAQPWSRLCSCPRLTPPSAQPSSALRRPRSEHSKPHHKHLTADSFKRLRRGNTSLTWIKRNHSCTKGYLNISTYNLKNKPYPCNRLSGPGEERRKGS